MPKNPQELAQLASQWANTVKNDIRTQLTNFLERSGLTEHEVAQVLSLSDGEVNQIIHGNGECTVTTLTKLLLATGNTIEIKPVKKSAINPYENVPERPMGQPTPQPMPQPRVAPRQQEPAWMQTREYGVDSKGRPLPPLEELFGGRPPRRQPSKAEMDRMLDAYWEARNAETARPTFVPRQTPRVAPQSQTPAFGQIQLPQGWKRDAQGKLRDERGHFVSNTRLAQWMENNRPQVEPQRANDDDAQEVAQDDYSAMTRDQLIGVIQNNLWDSEINIANATHFDLVQFLANKQRLLHQRTQNAQPQEQTQVNGGDDVDNFIDAMSQFLHENPTLAKQFRSIIGRAK